MNKFLQKGDSLQLIAASFSLSEPVVSLCNNSCANGFPFDRRKVETFPLYGNECIQDTIQSLAHLSQKHAAHLDFLQGATACFRAVIKLEFDYMIGFLNTKKQTYFNVLLEALVCLSVPRGNHGLEPNGAFTIVRLSHFCAPCRKRPDLNRSHFIQAQLFHCVNWGWLSEKVIKISSG